MTELGQTRPSNMEVFMNTTGLQRENMREANLASQESDAPGNWEEVATEAQVREEQQRGRSLPGPRPEITGDGLHTSIQAAWGEVSQPERRARRKVFLGYNPAK